MSESGKLPEKSELEILLDKDFSMLTMEQFKKLLKRIIDDTGPDAEKYLLIINCKILAEICKVLKT